MFHKIELFFKRIHCWFVGHDVEYGEHIAGVGMESFRLTPDFCNRCWQDSDEADFEMDYTYDFPRIKSIIQDKEVIAHIKEEWRYHTQKRKP
jgi:hypothetical protein